MNIVLDILTVGRPGIEDTFYMGWAQKKGAKTPEEALSRAGIHPEFAMICSLAFCVANRPDSEEVWSCKDVSEEKEMIQEFFDSIRQLGSDDEITLIGHNLKRFVYPHIVKAAIRHKIRIPNWLKSCKLIDIQDELAFGSQPMGIAALALNCGIPDQRFKISANVSDLFDEGNFSTIMDCNANRLQIILEIYKCAKLVNAI